MTLERAPSTLLLGAPGSGKTTSLITYIEAGLELFVWITDPGGEEALLDALQRKNLPLDRLHWRYIAAARPSWSTMQDMARKINDMTFEQIANIKTGIDKKAYQQFYQLVGSFYQPICEHCGKEFPPVDEWQPDMAAAVDSLSGLNTMAFRMSVGAKPSAHQGEWGITMNAEEQLINKFCADLSCFFCLTAHIEKEPNMITGVPTITASALGSKLAPKLPKDFSDVIMAKRDGTSFKWSVNEPGADLKARNVPLSNVLQPSFKQIVDGWRKREKFAATHNGDTTDNSTSEETNGLPEPQRVHQ